MSIAIRAINFSFRTSTHQWLSVHHYFGVMGRFSRLYAHSSCLLLLCLQVRKGKRSVFSKLRDTQQEQKARKVSGVKSKFKREARKRRRT